MDEFENQCYACPDGCNCSELGCVECEPETLRYTVQFGFKWACPCVSTAFLRNEVCTLCSNNSMLYNGKCFPCSTCTTCNIGGCTSCPPHSSLGIVVVGGLFVCSCDNPALVNTNGVCECPVGNYLTTDNSCASCPNYCHTCTNSTGTVTCTSCRPNSNRINAVSSNCVCAPGYQESVPLKTFCCSSKCATCDETGCLSCSSIANRVLSGTECVCMDTYVESGGETCNCPLGSVEYGGMCLTCPSQCLSCTFNTSAYALSCSACYNNSNRNLSRSKSC